MNKEENNTIDSPEKIPTRFIEYWNVRSAAGIASLFIENADFVNVVGLWWTDKNAIEKAHDYGLKVIFNKSTLQLIRSKVRYLSEDIAVIHAKMKLSGQTEIKDAEKPETRRNIFTFVAKKEGAEWQCVAAHNTDVIPGMETHVVTDGAIKAVDYRRK